MELLYKGKKGESISLIITLSRQILTSSRRISFNVSYEF